MRSVAAHRALASHSSLGPKYKFVEDYLYIFSVYVA